MSTRTFAALVLTAALVLGGTAFAAQATATPSVTSAVVPALPAAPGPAASAGTLDPALAAALVALVDEERMAHDLYQLFADTYEQARPFSMIVRSETQHVTSVRSLLAAYGISDPTTTLPAGTYATPAIQALFDQWKAAGLASLEAAEQVGVDLDTRDIADLRAALAGVTQTDITRLLGRLVSASENHLRAFTSAVADTSPSGMPSDGACLHPDAQPGAGHGNGTGPGVGMGQGYGNGMGKGTGAGTGRAAGNPRAMR